MLDHMLYDPRDWYWLVAGEEGVYASARRAFVAADDATYAAWRGAGGVATGIASADDLRAVLRAQGLRYLDDAPIVPLATILRRMTAQERGIVRQAFAADNDVFALALVAAGQSDVNTGSQEMAIIKQKLAAAAPLVFDDARIAALLAPEGA